MSDGTLRGVITPILTPFNDDGSIAEDLYVWNGARILAQGGHYLSPFGTTGEALSVSPRERRKAIEALVDGGAAKPEQLMPGTGFCSLDETVELTRFALELGCAGVMTLPPFFYKNATDEGLYRYFGELIEAIGSDRLKICLYHIPPMAVIGFSPTLTARLAEAYPDTIVAYKDSSGDWDNTRAVLHMAPSLSIFPGSELFLVDAWRNGGAGCISATCNVNMPAIRATYDALDAGDAAEADRLNAEIRACRLTVQAEGPIPAMKAMLAARTGDKRWLNLRAPLLNGDIEVGKRLADELEFEI